MGQMNLLILPILSSGMDTQNLRKNKYVLNALYFKQPQHYLHTCTTSLDVKDLQLQKHDS